MTEKKRKRIFTTSRILIILISISLFLLGGGIDFSETETYIEDNVGLINQQDGEEIESKAFELNELSKAEVFLKISEKTENPKENAKSFFKDNNIGNGLKQNGVLLYIESSDNPTMTVVAGDGASEAVNNSSVIDIARRYFIKEIKSNPSESIKNIYLAIVDDLSADYIGESTLPSEELIEDYSEEDEINLDNGTVNYIVSEREAEKTYLFGQDLFVSIAIAMVILLFLIDVIEILSEKEKQRVKSGV